MCGIYTVLNFMKNEVSFFPPMPLYWFEHAARVEFCTVGELTVRGVPETGLNANNARETL